MNFGVLIFFARMAIKVLKLLEEVAIKALISSQRRMIFDMQSNVSVIPQILGINQFKKLLQEKHFINAK